MTPTIKSEQQIFMHVFRLHDLNLKYVLEGERKGSFF